MEKSNIFALSSGAPPSGIAVIRMSGPDVVAVAERMTGGRLKDRLASLRTVSHPISGDPLDEGLVLRFSAPASFTGEDVVELQVHGSRAVVRALLSGLADVDDFSHAEAGAFSRRAFENGRMDLTALEGLSDLLAAQTEGQRRMARTQAAGALRAIYEDWRRQLLEARALIEAELDFSDEEGVPGSVSDLVWPRLQRLLSELEAHAAKTTQGALIREGYRVVLSGPPNSGKSSLFNALARQDIAIVTDVPGTTRDVLETQLEVSGQLVRVFDTAGIRETSDAVEAIGIRRAQDAILSADLILDLGPLGSRDAVDASLPVLERTVRIVSFVEDPGDADPFAIDARSTAGADKILSIIRDRLEQTFPASSEDLPNRQRHETLLKDAIRNLADALDDEAPLELRAETLRAAGDRLASLTGRIDTEELLGAIFSEFCVGK